MKKINRKEANGVFYPQSDKGRTVTIIAIETNTPIKHSWIEKKLAPRKIIQIVSYGNAKIAKGNK